MNKNISSSALDDRFRQLWRSFAATYGGLRLFSEQLPSVADRLDEQIIEEFAEVMADVFGDPPEQVHAEFANSGYTEAVMNCKHGGRLTLMLARVL